MLRDNLVRLIVPMRSCGTQALGDEFSYLENPRSVGAESSLTGRCSSPFQTEPRQIRATISGLTQTHLSISAAVNPSPQRPLCLSGRLTNGHFEMIKGLSLANTWRLEAGTKPLRTRAT